MTVVCGNCGKPRGTPSELHQRCMMLPAIVMAVSDMIANGAPREAAAALEQMARWWAPDEGSCKLRQAQELARPPEPGEDTATPAVEALRGPCPAGAAAPASPCVAHVRPEDVRDGRRFVPGPPQGDYVELEYPWPSTGWAGYTYRRPTKIVVEKARSHGYGHRIWAQHAKGIYYRMTFSMCDRFLRDPAFVAALGFAPFVDDG